MFQFVRATAVASVEARPSGRIVYSNLLATYLPHLISLSLGCIIFFCYFGVDLLLNRVPFLATPIGDIAAEEGAYLHFVQDGWHFPLFSMPNINLPEGSNLLFAGGVPLLALVAKSMHSASGLTFNLLGPWYLLCCMLQTHSMFVLMRQITDQRPLLLSFASITAVVANAFLTRMVHVSLFGQFMCIYPLAFVIATTNGNFRPRTIVVVLAAFAFASIFVFAYFAIMNSVMFLAGIASLCSLRQISKKQAALAILCFFALELILAGVGGYFWAAGRTEPAWIEGYRVYALNLGSLVDSDPSPRWWEGAFFLGWGVLGLWLLIFATGLTPIRDAFARNPWIVLFLALLTAYSLSNRVRFFDYTVFFYPLPHWIDPVLGMARTSGRLFWPTGYLLMAGAFAITAARFRRIGPPAITLSVVLSLYQSAAAYGHLRQLIEQPPPASFAYPELRRVMSPFKSVYIYPTIWCVPDLASKEEWSRTYQQLELVSAQLRMQSNSSLVARKIKDCELERRSLHRPSSGEIAFYMHRPALMNAYRDSSLVPEQCRKFQMISASGYACSASWTRQSDLPVEFGPADTALDR